MSTALVAAGVAVVGGAVVANDQAQRAKGEANKMRSAQKKAAESGIEFEQQQLDEQKYQFDQSMAEYNRKQALLEQQFAQTQRLIAPYITSGQGALYEMNALMGLAAPQQVTYNMQANPQTGQFEVTQQPTVQRPSPALGVGGAAPTTPTGGQLGILSQGVAPVRTGRGVLSGPASDFGAQIAAELNKGGIRMSDMKRWAGVSDTNPKKQAAVILSQTMAEMPNASSAEIHEAALQKAYAVGAMTPQQAGQAAAAESPIAQQKIETQVNPYAGMTGEQAQQTAIQRISESPLLAELTKQGEEAILQRSAATGGLRGGNVQGALAQFRPQMLQAEIDKYYNRLAGLSGTGQQSILSSPTMGQAGGYPTQYPTSNLGSYYSSLAAAGGIQPSAESQGGVNQALIGGLSQGIGAGLGYYANMPKTGTGTTTTNYTASGQLMPNTTTSGNFWSRPPG